MMVHGRLKSSFAVFPFCCAVLLINASLSPRPPLGASQAALLQVRTGLSSLGPKSTPSESQGLVGRDGTVVASSFGEACHAALSTGWAKAATDAQLLRLCTREAAPLTCRMLISGSLHRRPWQPNAVEDVCDRLGVARSGSAQFGVEERLAMTMTRRAARPSGKASSGGAAQYAAGLDEALASKVDTPENQTRVVVPPFLTGVAFPPDVLRVHDEALPTSLNLTDVLNDTAFDCEDADYADPSVVNASVLCTTTTTTTMGTTAIPGIGTGAVVQHPSEVAIVNHSRGSNNSASKLGTLNASRLADAAVAAAASSPGASNSSRSGVVNDSTSNVVGVNASRHAHVNNTTFLNSTAVANASRVSEANNTNETQVKVGNSTRDVNATFSSLQL